MTKIQNYDKFQNGRWQTYWKQVLGSCFVELLMAEM